ncbi:unnamed protein product [Cuscuta epithymum]|uniref:Uncharacterized protein n=1 Tax=Cuscuta epithymum TaxID=186058 RepID=A0AAV0F045_9ASTE|nr:unnamed protein product [Cuscuta epithymum]
MFKDCEICGQIRLCCNMYAIGESCKIWWCEVCDNFYALEFLRGGIPWDQLPPAVLSPFYGAHDLRWYIGDMLEASGETNGESSGETNGESSGETPGEPSGLNYTVEGNEVVLRRSTRPILLNRFYFGGDFVVDYEFGWLSRV